MENSEDYNGEAMKLLLEEMYQGANVSKEVKKVDIYYKKVDEF